MFIVLRMYKVPPRYEIALNDRAMNILAIGILCHIAMNTWIFTNPEIFPSEVKTIERQGDIYYYFSSANFSDRIFSANGLPYFILLCASFTSFFVLAPVFKRVAFVCCFKNS